MVSLCENVTMKPTSLQTNQEHNFKIINEKQKAQNVSFDGKYLVKKLLYHKGYKREASLRLSIEEPVMSTLCHP